MLRLLTSLPSTPLLRPQLNVGSIRNATKKAGGSTKNGRDSPGQRLGVKLYGGWVSFANDCLWRYKSLWDGDRGRRVGDGCWSLKRQGVYAYQRLYLITKPYSESKQSSMRSNDECHTYLLHLQKNAPPTAKMNDGWTHWLMNKPFSVGRRFKRRPSVLNHVQYIYIGLSVIPGDLRIDCNTFDIFGCCFTLGRKEEKGGTLVWEGTSIHSSLSHNETP